MMSLAKIMLLLCVLTLQSCATQNASLQLQPPSTSTHFFQQPEDLPELEQLFYLTAKQQHFLDYFQSPEQAGYPAEERLFNYLQNKLVFFNYESANSNAQQALEQLKGNCMTLALVTSALAKLVDIEVGYQVSYQQPMMDYKDNIFISSNHVRTYLYKKQTSEDNEEEQLVRRAAMVIDYFPNDNDIKGEFISASRFHAMLYNNLAADALLQGDSDRSFFLSQKALQQDATYTPSANIIALMYYRKKALSEANLWFDYGIKLKDHQITLLTNYRDLAEKMGNRQLLRDINQRLLNSTDNNPYAWLALALEAERNKQFDDAKLYYIKLLEKAPYLHNANQALVRLYLKEQNFSSAQRTIEKAMYYAYEPARREFYNTKLEAMKQHRNNLQKQHH
jgi:Tfp pilus assembly protein PilF